MNNPLITVVVPCLNRADFLEPTLESILQQDYPHIECIVVDGGSTDGTLEILKRYNDRIQWISEPDNGHADAINKGWRMGRGEILAWLNADDVWAVPDAVSRVVACWQDHPAADVIYGDCGSIDIDGNLIGMAYLHRWNLAYAVEHCDHCIPQAAAFIRRAAIDRVGWLDTDFYQKKDHELWLRIGLTGQIHYLPRLLAYARKMTALSQEGKTAAPACIQLTKKFYSLPNVPAAIQQKKQRAFSNSYLRGINYAFEGDRHWNIIFNYTLRAFLADPTNLRVIFYRAKQYLSLGAQDDKRLRRLYRALKLTAAPLLLTYRAINQFRSSTAPRPRNLLGDRDIEWSWVAATMPAGPGHALDFGTGGSPLALIASQRGFDVTAVDLQHVTWPYTRPKLRFIRGDILKLPLPPENFDLIINCSTVEHVGLAGRYSVSENNEPGDLQAMARLHSLMKPGGVMLLTIPVGQDAVFGPMTRIYGHERLPRLLTGYNIVKEAYWVKDEQNRWVETDKDTALKFKAEAGAPDAMQNIYALGCFVLKHGYG